MPQRPACCALRPRRPSSMPSCPALPQPIRDPAFSKGSQIWLRKPQSGPTSSCSLPWLSSFAPPPLVSPLGCPRLPPPSTALQTRFFSFPPYPPLALETSLAVFTFLLFSYGCCLTVIGPVGGIVYVCFFSFVSFIFGLVFAISLKMHVISCTVETMNISFKKKNKKKKRSQSLDTNHLPYTSGD